MSLENHLLNHLLSTFGPLLTLEQLAQLLHRSPKGLAFTLSTNSDLAGQINSMKVRLGRRVYFRSCEVAALLGGDRE